MAVFSCPECGGRAFKLSTDLKQAYCDKCKLSLGSWQELKSRLKLRSGLNSLNPRDMGRAGIFLYCGFWSAILLRCCHYAVSAFLA